LDWVDVNDNGDVIWQIEEDGFWGNYNRRAVTIGRKNGDMVDIAQEFGGGQASFSGLQDVASKFWREYSDISASPEIVQNNAINGAIDRTRRGQSIDTASAPWQYASDSLSGIGQGGLNAINGTKNVAFSITDLPRQTWNAGQWYVVKGAGLVGVGNGGRGAWADGDWSIPQTDGMRNWNANVLVDDAIYNRHLSENLGGSGVLMLLPMPKAFGGARAPHNQVITVTEDISLIRASGRVWGQTEGSVYGMTTQGASRARTMANAKVRDPGTIVFEGQAASLFRPHPVEGWYSGLKRLLGQQKSGFGDIVFSAESAAWNAQAATLTIQQAQMGTHAGQSTLRALSRLWGRRLGIEPLPIYAGATGSALDAYGQEP